MSKTLQINIKAEGTVGRVDIIGNISEWGDNNAIDFRERCQEAKDAGATTCLVYLMTNGGDCFQASEIVNILNEIFGSYIGEGGALVASAGTYVAVNATSFTMAKNGQFMVHKPSGSVYGTETDMENYLKLLKNMTISYYDSYKAKLKKPEADFKTKWDGGDFWMTAQEAKDWGFITDIKEPVKVTKAMAESIKAIGSPFAFDPQDIIISKPNNSTEMDYKLIAVTLGMDANSTEEQVNAKIAENARKAKDYEALQASNEKKEKETLSAKIKVDLDKAEVEKRINASERPIWENALTANYDANIVILNGKKAVESLSSKLVADSKDGKTYQGKTFEQLQDESPDMLASLQDENPEAYNTLFADWKNRNRIK